MSTAIVYIMGILRSYVSSIETMFTNQYDVLSRLTNISRIIILKIVWYKFVLKNFTSNKY